MAGGGGTNTVTRTELDPTMRPYVEYGLEQAKQLYQQPALPSFYPGATYVGPSQTTQQAMNLAQQRASMGSPLVRGAQQTVGTLQTAVNPALGGFADVYNRAMYDPSAGVYQQMAQGGMVNPAMAGTQQTAAGAYLGGNPFFQGAFAPAARQAEMAFGDAMQRIASQSSQAGRYGSNAMGQLQDRASGQFAQALSDVAGQLAYQNYGAERGMQEAAMGRLGALGQQDVANIMAGAGALSQGYQQGLGTQLQAAGGLGSTAASDYARQLQAAQTSPALAQQDYADIQQLLGLGQMQEGYQEMALADAMNRFNFAQMQPYQKLQSYLSAAYGAPMGMQQSQPIFRNQLGGGLSGAASGAALGSMIMPGLGTGVGAALGGLAGLLG